MHMKKGTNYAGKKQRSFRLNQTPLTGNTRIPPTSLADHLISQPSLDISLIWTPIIAAEVRKLQLRPA
jgi:hypothetical protein